MKGRPPISPRLQALEDKVKQLEERIAKLEQGTAVRDPPEWYKPLFEKWPVNGST